MAERAGSVLWKLSLGGKEVDIKDIVQHWPATVK